MRFVLVFVLLLAGSSLLAQCDEYRNGVYVVKPYEWRELPGDLDHAYLFKAGVQLGAWNYPHIQWRDFDTRTGLWSLPRPTPPITPPEKMQNFGVDTSKLRGGNVYHTVDAEIPDDSKKFRLTVPGAAEERARITDAWKTVEPSLKERVIVWNVPSDHWSLQDGSTGKTVFKTSGLTLTAPDGKVLHRQEDFTGAQDFEAIRKAVKGYDPLKDPDLRKPDLPIKPAPMPIPIPLTLFPPWLALIATAGGYFLVQRRK